MTLIERLKVKLKATALDGNAIPLNHSTVAEIIQTLERQEEHIRVKNAHLSVASTDKPIRLRLSALHAFREQDRYHAVLFSVQLRSFQP